MNTSEIKYYAKNVFKDNRGLFLQLFKSWFNTIHTSMKLFEYVINLKLDQSLDW